MTEFLDQTIIKQITNLALKAGDLVMNFYNKPLAIEIKPDNSPVTIADIEANNFIVQALNNITPNINVISEESDNNFNSAAEIFWLVDPIDGTKSFIRSSGQFTINIALISKQLPLFGVIYAPLTNTLYFNNKNIAYKQYSSHPPEEINVNNKKSMMTAVISTHHRNAQVNNYLSKMDIKSVITASSSIKFCLLAEGTADIYPNFGPTMEWDTAAGHAILNAAGGSVQTHDNLPLKYGKKNFANNFFIAYGNSM